MFVAGLPGGGASCRSVAAEYIMITVAGAKGGCGTTTAALELGRAFARAGSRTLVVDGDRQLPNLHAVAGVDREPTLVDAGADPWTVGLEDPVAEGVRILPAPTDRTEADVEGVLAALARNSEVTRTIVDCPSGLGPDAVEAMSPADAVVLATTGGERGLREAERTATVARRIGVPVAGVVLNRCASVPVSLRDRLEAPVLGAIPNRESPPTDPAVRRGYDRVVAELRARRYDERESVAPWAAADRMATGIEPLDRAFDGGFPPGSVVVLRTPPASQSELLLHELTATRGTLYLSTEREESVVRHEMDASTATAGAPTVRSLTDEADPLAAADALVGALPDGANLVVDSVGELERRGRESYVEFLNGLKRTVRERSCLVVLHCLESEDTPAARPTTIHAADAVLDVNPERGSETSIEVPKFRTLPLPDGGIEVDLDLSAGVSAAD